MFSRCSFSSSSMIPPWLWVIAFGNPVVPLENKIQSGIPNGPVVNSKSAAATSGPLQQRVPVFRVLGGRRDVAERQVDHVLEAVELLDDLGELAAAVVVLAAVPVAAGADQHLRLELAEPVEHPAPAEVGGDRVQIAPMLVTASIASSASGTFGRQEATRSPAGRRGPRAGGWQGS